MAEGQTKTLTGSAAVMEAMPGHPAIQALLAWKEDGLLDAKWDRGELTLAIDKDDIVPALRALHAGSFDFFEDMTAVDWYPSIPRFQLTYHLLSLTTRQRVRVRAMVDESDTTAESITTLWQGANYYEREVFDLFGIRFAGHPNLRRIMMPDEWKGHPLRKDYPVEGYR
jgi:NADH-quinone oxidoreductase subunit C